MFNKLALRQVVGLLNIQVAQQSVTKSIAFIAMNLVTLYCAFQV